jgi:hypothetical protein
MKKLIRFRQCNGSKVNSKNATGFISEEAVRTQDNLVQVSELFPETWQIKHMGMNVSEHLRSTEKFTSQLSSPVTVSESRNSLESLGYSFETGV